ncbi:hypothetical protein BJ170DRAFT_715891 [Xylariales sp. AK1849]|nr:hypothetical protein BJ170DRAFT_715891 [Xylariales sp. AK1849]
MVEAIGSPAAFTSADEATWFQSTFPVNFSDEGPRLEYHMEGQSHPWTQYDFLNGPAGGSCLQLGQMDLVSPLDWSSSTSETGVFEPNQANDNQHIHQCGVGDSDIATNLDSSSQSPDANGPGSASRNFTERLAYLQVHITRMSDCGPYTGLSELLQEVAHVLESSSKLLELIKQVLSNAPTCRATQQQSLPFDRAVFLQLTSMGMRLTEMHIWLYSSIHHCVQQQDGEMVAQDDNAKEAANAQPNDLLFSIAGVELEPSPRFWLHIVLQAGVHYLARIQKSLDTLEAFAFDGESEGPSRLAVQTQMLISEDRRGRTARIRSLLDILNKKFGMGVHQVLLQGSGDKTVILWDADTGERQQTLEGHTDWVRMAFSPDGKVVASASHDKMVILWDADTGERQQKIDINNKYILTDTRTFVIYKLFNTLFIKNS